MDKLRINMLGEFSLSYGSKTVSEQSKRSKKIWPLLEYLVIYHDRGVSQNELIELLWGEEQSDNPFGALKTQMHRLRSILAELECPENIVINTNGTYAFNTELDYEIDVEVFENKFKAASAPDISPEEKLVLLLQAIDLYTGDFLAKSAYESWVVPINTYYHSIFTKAAHTAVELLEKEGRLHDISTVCNKAVSIDPYDETMHYHLIKVLAALGEQQSAKRHYEYVTDLLYSKFGITPSKELMELYEQTIKSKKNIETDIKVVTANLMEEQHIRGAFFCEYQIFKHLYQLEMRDSERTHTNICICLVTITDSNGELPAQNPLNKAMERLKNSISCSLRGSDVFARYSISQYIVMLPNISEQHCDMVLKRIEKNFRRENTNKDIELNFRFSNSSSGNGNI